MMDTYVCLIAPIAFALIMSALIISVDASLRRFTGAAIADRLLKLDEAER